MEKDFSGKRVTVIGLGRSGQAAARLLIKLNAQVKMSDQSSADEISGEFREWASQNNIEIERGGHTQGFIEGSDLVVLSPGVRMDADPVKWASSKGIPVVGEIELASRYCNVPIIGVTGSNGKTTVATLIREALEKSGKKVFLCGNMGAPFADYVLDSEKVDYVVLELSSFQLESVDRFKPFIAVFLNFSRNHLDRHDDMEEYFQAKGNIFRNQDADDHAVLNEMDPRITGLAENIKSEVHYFGAEEFNKNGKSSLNIDQRAVLVVAGIVGLNEGVTLEALKEFQGVEHRLEFVGSIEGVDFINDSKSTTTESGRWALENIDKPVVMICGGRDKNLDFLSIKDIVKDKVKKMFVIGEASEKIKNAYSNVVSVEECDRLEGAVQKARKIAEKGDCIILSPMCASFDMYANFEERGTAFKKIVNELER